MKMSIRKFLLINLLLGELLTTLIGLSVLFFLGHRDMQATLDDHLLQSAFAIQSLMGQPKTPEQLHDLQGELATISQILAPQSDEQSEEYPTDKIFYYHVWDKGGNLLLGSEDFIPEYFSHAPIGFSQLKLGHHTWRALSTIDPINKIVVTLVQKRDKFELLPGHTASEILLITLLSYPFLALIIWLVLERGLGALRRVSSQVQQQAPERLSYIDGSNLPLEIRPIAEEWNKLFDRLTLAFDREKRFAADAAHELKTPLAALKTHTQLALNAKNENELVNALHKIVTGVNRSAHVVQQLLTLNNMNHGLITEAPVPINIIQQAREVIADLVPQALEKNSDIELLAPDTLLSINGHDTAIAILIRNLVDNAIRYSPEHSLVQVVIEESTDKQSILLKVVDNGPGIPPSLRQRVFERFFRVIGNKSSGSGLGLGIVQQIAALHGATISLETPSNGHGLEIMVAFPKLL